MNLLWPLWIRLKTMNLRLTILLVVVLAPLRGNVGELSELHPLRTSHRSVKPWMYHIDESTITHISVAHAGEMAEFARPPGSVNLDGPRRTRTFRCSTREWSGTTPSPQRTAGQPGAFRDHRQPGGVRPGTGGDGRHEYPTAIGKHLRISLGHTHPRRRKPVRPAGGRRRPVHRARTVGDGHQSLGVGPAIRHGSTRWTVAAIRAIEVTSGDAKATYFIDSAKRAGCSTASRRPR